MSAKKTTAKSASQPETSSRVNEVNMDVSVELGRVRLPIERILSWTEGSLIELDKVSGDPAEVRVNGVPFGKGEVVTIGENFGIRITEIDAQE
ncbi:MAG: FliM/FliN family flagellar motor switch protein [bacterium]|nr:FliM/FliN family flagellar motor switch protein [bacterium]